MLKMTVLFVKKISETATIPKKGTKNSAGYDIYASEETIILAGKTTKIKTGISIKLQKEPTVESLPVAD